MLWFHSGKLGLSPVAATPVEATVTGLSLGRLDDDGFTDVAIVAGGRMSILHGTDLRALGQKNRLEAIPLPFRAAHAVAGSPSFKASLASKSRCLVTMGRYAFSPRK